MKKILIVLLALFVVFAMLGCDSGTTPRTPPGDTDKDKDKDKDGDKDVKVEFPVIYANGKFMDGAEAEEGEYEVNSGTITKGKVTLKTDHIEVTYADGKNGWDGADVLGYYTLVLILDPDLDITGYKGVKITWEGIAEGTFQYCGINVDLIDSTLDGNLALQAEEKASPSTALISGAKDWGDVELADFTYEIKRIELNINTVKDSTGTVIPLKDRTAWKVKSVEFTK